jgi:tetratricopeptide (TPR) repeat protein/tRNA A-37 threonylcarbamoyl transferase component Bud32
MSDEPQDRPNPDKTLTSADETQSAGGAALPQRVDRYHIKRIIATGGMGTVYEATQENPRRVVAVKVMKHGIASRSAMRRFEYEAQLLARLRHPGIAQIYEAGTHDDGSGPVPYFAMEYIPAARPITAFAQEKKLGTRARLELLAKVCDAVHHGHQKGIIHRDLKPGNILVDSAGEVKIIDFGVARGTDSDLAVTTLQTDIGQLIGTLQYMSPEQCAADPHDIDVRSDVYALGVVLYELLSGKLPYDVRGQGGMGILPVNAIRVIREQEPSRLSTTIGWDGRPARHLRGDVETIVSKALEKDRERRYQSAVELAQDIRRYLAGEAIVARPPSIVYQLRIFARRHRALLLATAIVFTVLLGATVTSTVFYARARTQRARAEQAATRLKTENLLLQDIVAALNPRSLRSQGPAVASAISAASQRLDEGLLSGDVDTEVKLRRLLGDVYYVFGEYDNAAWQYRKATSLLKGADRLATADMFENVYTLACLAAAQGRSREAMALLEDALPLSTEALGREHPRIVIAEGLLAMLHGDAAGTQAAVESYRRIADWHLKDAHLPDVEKARYLAFVVEMSLDTGRALEVEVYCRQLLALDRRVYGERHVYVAYASKSLALSLEAQGRFAEAEELLRQALDIEIEVLHKGAPEVGRTLANIGRVAAKQGRLADAEHELREALKILDVRAPEIWVRYDARSTLGGVLSDQGKFAEAELLLLPSYEELARDPLTWPDRECDALQRIVRLYEAWGKPDEAATWRTKLEGAATKP